MSAALCKLRELVHALSGAEGGVALVDAAGFVLEASAPVPAEVGAALERETDREAPAKEPGEQRIGDRATLFSAELSLGQAAPARLVVWIEGVGSDLDRLRTAMPTLRDVAADDWRAHEELDRMALELSERYDELNLVFDLERGVTGSASDDITGQLGVFASRARVSAAFFLAAGEASRTWTVDDHGIANLDFVLAEVRGRLFRFLSAAGRALVLNEPDDPRREFLLTHLPFKVLACPATECRMPESMVVLLRPDSAPDFSNSDLALARIFVGQAEQIRRARGLHARLAAFNRQMAGSLVEAMEAKDPYTRGHSERVERISVGLGESLALEPDEIEDLYWGALLHDVGKIGIPDVILRKPGRLTPDEFLFIQTHPEQSYEIIRHIEGLREGALFGARYHQERYDGKGYPFGLAGTEIPLMARIIAVADTYDAITSSRSYRPARSHEVAMEVIREVAGEQLDPDVVRSFVALSERDAGLLRAIDPAGGGAP